MAKFSDYQLILDELKMTLSHVEADEFSTFASKILHAEHIFVAGKGRSGFVANSFAMRLNQLGKQAHVVGESTTPAIKSNDDSGIIPRFRFHGTFKIISRQSKISRC